MKTLIFSFLSKIQEFLEGLEEVQWHRLLVLVLNNGRGSLDYARRLLENDDPKAGSPDPTNDSLN